MTIKEVEEQTGLTRSNIRFYEKEKLNKERGHRSIICFDTFATPSFGLRLNCRE